MCGRAGYGVMKVTFPFSLKQVSMEAPACIARVKLYLFVSSGLGAML